MNVTIEAGWKAILEEEFEKPEFEKLMEFVDSEYENGVCFPPKDQIFSAFNHTPFNKVKVVIIGQDPYHNEGEANGLCFSVKKDIKFPPSLINIFKKLESEIKFEHPKSGDLECWANQGVLLINAVLTVNKEKKANSHKNKGWEKFTDAIIEKLSSEREGIVFMLWGNYAQKKGSKIDTKKHKILKSIHPSPLSVNKDKEGWFGVEMFKKANEYLGKENEIIWNCLSQNE